MFDPLFNPIVGEHLVEKSMIFSVLHSGKQGPDSDGPEWRLGDWEQRVDKTLLPDRHKNCRLSPTTHGGKGGSAPSLDDVWCRP